MFLTISGVFRDDAGSEHVERGCHGDQLFHWDVIAHQKGDRGEGRWPRHLRQVPR